MATKKVKRYSGEDGESEVSVPEEAAPAKEESFGEAFKRNRSAGEKTFEWKGKKYTTETKEDQDKAKAKAKEDAERKRQSDMVKNEKGLERVAPEMDLLPVGKLVGAMGAGAAALKGGEKAIKAMRAARAAKRSENAATSGAMKGEARADELRYKRGGSVKSASARADGCAIRGKTRA